MFDSAAELGGERILERCHSTHVAELASPGHRQEPGVVLDDWLRLELEGALRELAPLVEGDLELDPRESNGAVSEAERREVVAHEGRGGRGFGQYARRSYRRPSVQAVRLEPPVRQHGPSEEIALVHLRPQRWHALPSCGGQLSRLLDVDPEEDRENDVEQEEEYRADGCDRAEASADDQVPHRPFVHDDALPRRASAPRTGRLGAHVGQVEVRSRSRSAPRARRGLGEPPYCFALENAALTVPGFSTSIPTLASAR